MAPIEAKRGVGRLTFGISAAALMCIGAPASAQMRDGANGPATGLSIGQTPMVDPATGLSDIVGPQPVPDRRPRRSRIGGRDDGATQGRPPGFHITPRGEVDLTYTDNVLVSNTNRQGDFIVSPGAGLLAEGSTAKSRYFVDGAFAYDFYKDTTSFDGARVHGLADFRTEMFDRLLDFDARASTGQQRISTFDRGPATERSFGGNQAQVTTYGATPTVRWSTGNFADVEASYDFQAVNYASAGASNTVVGLGDFYQHTGTLRLSNGSDFGRFGWALGGSVQRQDRGGFNSDRYNGNASLTYLVRYNFQLIGTVGYDHIDEPNLTQTASGTFATGGFRWSPGTRTDIQFDGGWRYREPYFSGHITYAALRWMRLRGSYTETIDTPQSVVGRNLLNAVSGPDGVTRDPLTGLPVDPTISPFGLSNVPFRRKALELSVDGTVGRNSYALTGLYERRNAGASTAKDVRGTAALGRQLTPSLKGTLSLSYDRVTGSTISVGEKSTTLQARAQLDYAVGHRTNVALSYIYQRLAAPPLVRTRENVGMLILTRKF